jgi:AdoMet-dependent heme synthase
MSHATPTSESCMARPTPLMDRVISRTARKHLPLDVHFDLTYRCNERCVHCYLDHRDYGELTTPEILGVLEDLAAAGTLFLTFSGGEIFLRPDLFDILAAARRLHFDISLKTNALLVTPQRAARLRELGVRRVQISIYSDDPAVHDAVTKVPGSLERSLAAIPLLQAEGLHVKIACPLMTENLSGFRGVLVLAESMGVPYVFDMTITPMMGGETGPLAHRVTGSQLLPVLQEPKLGGCRPGPVDAAALPATLGSASSSGIESDAYDDLPCSAGHNSCYISPYGDVYPCVQLPVPAGNLRRERFEHIWNGAPAFERVRAVRESQLPVCSACSIRKYCERCPGLALMEGGDLLGAYERACELAEIKARAAGVANPVSALHARRRSADFSVPAEALAMS